MEEALVFHLIFGWQRTDNEIDSMARTRTHNFSSSWSEWLQLLCGFSSPKPQYDGRWHDDDRKRHEMFLCAMEKGEPKCAL